MAARTVASRPRPFRYAIAVGKKILAHFNEDGGIAAILPMHQDGVIPAAANRIGDIVPDIECAVTTQARDGGFAEGA